MSSRIAVTSVSISVVGNAAIASEIALRLSVPVAKPVPSIALKLLEREVRLFVDGDYYEKVKSFLENKGVI